MLHHVGTSGFAYPEWKGRFYTAKFPNKDVLGYYAGQFSAVEIGLRASGKNPCAGGAGW